MLGSAVAPAALAAACTRGRDAVRGGDRARGAPRRIASCASRPSRRCRSRSARRFRRCPTSRSTRSTACRRRSTVAAPSDSARDADVDRPAPADAARRHARVHAEGTAADADRVRRGDRTRHAAAVRAVRRSTNGTETYPGGRYLDLDRTATGIYDLDFNRAYHPFCFFNPTYDCPVPPRENRLTIPIRAGEQLGRRVRTSMIAAIVFDFDGVLADSEPLHLRAYQEVLEPLGIALPREEYYAQLSRLRRRRACSRRWPRRGDWRLDDATRSTALIADEGRGLRRRSLAGARHAVSRAPRRASAARGASIRSGIASGALRHEIEAMLARRAARAPLPLHRRRPATRRRASRRPIPICAPRRCTAVPPAQCVAIEDSRWGIESAKAAGLCVRRHHPHLSGRRAARRRRHHHVARRADAGADRLDRLSRATVEAHPRHDPTRLRDSSRSCSARSRTADTTRQLTAATRRGR